MWHLLWSNVPLYVIELLFNYWVVKKKKLALQKLHEMFLGEDITGFFFFFNHSSTCRKPSNVRSDISGSGLLSCINMLGRISSSARTPTVECKLSNVLAAACRTSGSGSHNALRTVGTREFTNVSTWRSEAKKLGPTQSNPLDFSWWNSFLKTCVIWYYKK